MSEIETSSVYLLVSKDKPMFKIGKADDIIRRMDTLKKHWGDFDISKSIEIKCHEKKVYKFEKTLHLIFEDYRLTFNESADGYTEWFDISCFPDVLSFLENTLSKNSNILSVTKGIPSPSIPKSSALINGVPYRQLSKEEKMIYRRQKKRERMTQSFIENKMKIENFIRVIRDSKEDILYFNRGLDYSGLIVFKSKNENMENSLLKYNNLSFPRGGTKLFGESGSGPGYYYLKLMKWDELKRFVYDNQDGNREYINFLHDFYSTLEQDNVISNDYDQGVSFLNDREEEFIEMVRGIQR